MRTAIIVTVIAFTFFVLLQPASAIQVAPYESTTQPGILAVQKLNSTDNGTETRIFTVIVGSSGFNGSAYPINIQVSQGDKVTIRFVYGDGSLSFDNPHIILIDGYNIETGKIDRETPVQELTFTAGQVGNFHFHCALPCVGMENLQQGTLVVATSKQGAPIATNLTQMKVENNGNGISISARLTDQQGAPVSGAIVNFYVSTDFGPLNLGQNATASDGSVQFEYSPGSLREMVVTAAFAGSGRYMESKAATSFIPQSAQGSGGVLVLVSPGALQPPANLVSPYLSGQVSAMDLRLVGVQPVLGAIIVTIALLIVISVWSVYALVVKEILAVRKAGKAQERNL